MRDIRTMDKGISDGESLRPIVAFDFGCGEGEERLAEDEQTRSQNGSMKLPDN